VPTGKKTRPPKAGLGSSGLVVGSRRVISVAAFEGDVDGFLGVVAGVSDGRMAAGTGRDAVEDAFLGGSSSTRRR